MSQVSKFHQVILDNIASRRALVVEGKTDRLFFERQLDAAHNGWRSKWLIGEANGKQRVLDILALQPTWIGIVDTDEWDTGTVTTLKSQYPNLHFMPRYCVESYYILASEIWALLQPAHQKAIRGGLPAFTTAINATLDQWVRHGALWRTINPLWKGIQTRGFVKSLLNLSAAQSDTQIQSTLAAWDAYLDPNVLFADFQRELSAANAAAVDDRLKTVVHGKTFFEDHVRVTLNTLFRSGQSEWSADDWLKDLRQSQPAHPDFAPLWSAMGLP